MIKELKKLISKTIKEENKNNKYEKIIVLKKQVEIVKLGKLSY